MAPMICDEIPRGIESRVRDNELRSYSIFCRQPTRLRAAKWQKSPCRPTVRYTGWVKTANAISFFSTTSLNTHRSIHIFRFRLCNRKYIVDKQNVTILHLSSYFLSCICPSHCTKQLVTHIRTTKQ